MSAGYPKMLYRGDEQLIVPDEQAQAVALKGGWRTRDQLQALDLDGDDKPGGSKPRVKRQPEAS